MRYKVTAIDQRVILREHRIEITRHQTMTNSTQIRGNDLKLTRTK